MMGDSDLSVSVTTENGKVVSVQWDGPTARVSKRLVDEFPNAYGFYELGSFLAREMPGSYNSICDTCVLIKVDHPLAGLYAGAFRIKQMLSSVGVRLVYTMAIWGLARMPQRGEYIGWHLVREKWSKGQG